VLGEAHALQATYRQWSGFAQTGAVVTLPDPVPAYLPAGFTDPFGQAMEGGGVPLATGPATPVDVPMVTRMRTYAFDTGDPRGVLKHGPVIRVMVSPSAAQPPEWFDGLSGDPVEVPGGEGYLRATGTQISLIVVAGDLLFEVVTAGVGEHETLAVARSLPFPGK
jgi:hypothetical protein